MNWTGGSLQRTKNANKGILQKQKAYFAKARAPLQNALNSPVTPFRPSFLCDADDSDLAGQMPSFGSGSVRHIGHSTRRRGEGTQRDISPSDMILVSGYDGRPTLGLNPSRGLLRHGSGTIITRCTYNEQQLQKRKAEENDFDSQLLEANRKRLLKEQDWIGINPSKPVNLRYLSSKEKDKIGKRRKIEEKHSAAVRQSNDADFPVRLQPAYDAFAGAFTSGAISIDPENIRIRIGTDALATAYSQTNEHVQSQASSEPMLFDQESRDAERVRSRAFAYPVNSTLQLTRYALRQVGAVQGERILTDERVQRYHGSVKHQRRDLSRDASEQSSSDDNLFELQAQETDAIDARNREEDDSAPGCQITHQVEGIVRPLHFVFDDSNSSAGARTRIASRNNTIGETKFAQGTEPTGSTQRRPVYSENEHSAIDEAAAALPIADEEPWKTFLAISNRSSSHSTQADEPGKSVLHSSPTARNNEAVAGGSQHVTQGDQSHVSSSCLSASLPSPKRGREKPASARPSGVNPNRRGDTVCPKSPGPNEDERLWQAFVFGSDNKSSSETTHDHEQDSGQRMSRDFGESSSRYLPLSAAVSSASSTPFRSVLGFDSCISDNAQDKAAFAPPPGPGTFTSPAFHGFVEELGKEEEGNEMAERTAFGEQSVTHASLQDNPSRDSELMSPKVFSNARASRSGLHKIDHTSDHSYVQATASRRVSGRDVERSASIYAILVSDDFSEGLDLVDPDKLL